jgi:hypothetical protein
MSLFFPIVSLPVLMVQTFTSTLEALGAGRVTEATTLGLGLARTSRQDVFRWVLLPEFEWSFLRDDAQCAPQLRAGTPKGTSGSQIGYLTQKLTYTSNGYSYLNY